MQESGFPQQENPALEYKPLFALCLIAGYVALAGGGLVFAFAHGTVSPVWPATGFAIAVLTLWGPELWPAVAIGAFTANFVIAADPVAVSAVIAFGNTLEALGGALALRHLGVTGEIGRLRDALAILAVALLAPLPAAGLGPASLMLAGLLPAASFPQAALVWWTGDCMGALIVLPLLLAWLGEQQPSSEPARPGEFAAVLATTVGLAALATWRSEALLPLGMPFVPLGVFLFPPMLWAALRLRPREATLVLAAAALLAVLFRLQGLQGDALGPLLTLQLMLLGIGGGSLVMLGAITELTRAREAELVERVRLAAVLDSLSEGVVVADLAGKVLEMNPAALQLHGYTQPDEWRGLPEFADIFELRSLDGRLLPLGEWPLSRLLRGERYVELEVELRRTDQGLAHLVSYSGTPVRNRAGETILCVLTLRDMGAKRRADLALRASEAQLSAIFEHAAVGIVHISLPERRFLRVNEAFCRITGFSREVLLGMTSTELTHPDDRPIGAEDYARLSRGELSAFTIEKRYLRKDGSFIWAQLTLSAVRENGGTASFAIGVIEDVTAEKLAEQARQDAERRLELAVSIAELGFWEWERDGERLYLSPLWKQHLGYADDELPSTLAAWRACIHPEDAQRVNRYVRRYLVRPDPDYRLEYRMRHRDGRYRWIASRALAVLDRRGRVTKLVGTHLDITERKEAEASVREAALHDPLTQLPNRALVLEYGGHLLAAAQRRHGRGALLFVDLDRFKPINDTYGHEMGDRVLQEVARRLLECTRQEDLVGRHGGDEFVILLPHLDRDRHWAIVVAQHVIEALSRPIHTEGLELSISPSIGISHFPEHGRDMEALIRSADLAMYEAKEAGRACFRLFTPALEPPADDVTRLEGLLRRALDNDGLALYYQPVIALPGGQLIGAEALVRLPDEDGDEPVAAARLLPVAETAGLIEELGNWVLRAAGQQYAAWRSEGLPPLCLAINLSPLQLRGRGLAARLETLISEAGLDPQMLQLDVSEVRGQEHAEELCAAFRHLQALGVRIALDRFGAGQTCLARLGALPLDKLKLDPGLVSRIGSDPASLALARALIALGRTLGLAVVGEGIESEAILQLLQESGCDEAQGFWVSRPLPPDEFARWCRRQPQPAQPLH